MVTHHNHTKRDSPRAVRFRRVKEKKEWQRLFESLTPRSPAQLRLSLSSSEDSPFLFFWCSILLIPPPLSPLPSSHRAARYG